MIAPKIFLTYSTEQKKDYLLGILLQLEVTPEIEDSVALLDSGFSFSDATLDGVFQQLNTVIQEAKTATIERTKESMHKIHQNLEKEAQESRDEADALIDDIEL